MKMVTLLSLREHSYGFQKVLSPSTVLIQAAFMCLLALVSAIHVRSFAQMPGDP